MFKKHRFLPYFACDIIVSGDGIFLTQKEGKKMSKKLILSSFVALALASPAVAEPTNTSDTFPSNGYMQPDYTYLNAAVESNLGVHEGSVTATAEYSDNIYNADPGWYLPAASTEPAQCLANNYCSGATNLLYSKTEPQGIVRCPNRGSADLGSDSLSDCYRGCSLAPNAGAMVEGGRDYEQSGKDTCRINFCNKGYTKLEGEALTNDMIQTMVGTVSGEMIIQDPPLPDIWQVFYRESNTELVGQSRCGDRPAASLTPTDVVENVVGGTHCYCNLTGFTNVKNDVTYNLASKWFYIEQSDDCNNSNANGINYCKAKCAEYMKGIEGNQLTFREKMLDNIQYVSDVCKVNTITITWENADPADVSANNAGSVEYGGDIRTPVKATDVPGKTFRGWIFKNVSQ